MSVLVKSVHRWFKLIWELHWNSVINRNHPHPRLLWLPLSVLYSTVFIFHSYTCCSICDLFSLFLPLFGFTLSVSFCLRALHPTRAFLSRPSNLFLPLKDKCYVRGLCFPPSPSQRIYDAPAVQAISQGCVVHCRSKPGWTVVPGVHHKHLRLV